MKKILSIVLLSLFASQSFAAEIIGASVDKMKGNLLLDVSYGGGCGTHDFSLKLEGCYESYPVQCEAQLVHVSNDSCEAIIRKIVVIPLSANGLLNSYYKRGRLTIKGDVNWRTDKPSFATVTLP